MSTKTIHAIISGRVQGVCFRYYTRETAQRLGIQGWVRNLGDGRVELEATGNNDAMTQFEKWISHGPPMAHVADISVTATDSVADGAHLLQTFEIRNTPR